MKRFQTSILLLLVFLVSFGFTNCTTVKPYQKVYLNDSDMDLGGDAMDEFGTNFQSYREGAVGGNDGNKGNGCGCN